MNRHRNHRITRIACLLLAALTTVLLVIAAAGCGKETEQASQQVDEVNAIAKNVEAKRAEVDKALFDAFSKMSAGDAEAERTNLNKALDAVNAVIPDISSARDKTRAAAGLDISDAYRQYLEAKTRSLDAALRINELDREMINTLLADPAMEKPETTKKVTELQKTITEQTTILSQAEAEADKIAAEHKDEINAG